MFSRIAVFALAAPLALWAQTVREPRPAPSHATPFTHPGLGTLLFTLSSEVPDDHSP
jgi:hypothetical protein